MGTSRTAGARRGRPGHVADGRGEVPSGDPGRRLTSCTSTVSTPGSRASCSSRCWPSASCRRGAGAAWGDPGAWGDPVARWDPGASPRPRAPRPDDASWTTGRVPGPLPGGSGIRSSATSSATGRERPGRSTSRTPAHRAWTRPLPPAPDPVSASAQVSSRYTLSMISHRPSTPEMITIIWSVCPVIQFRTRPRSSLVCSGRSQA